MTCHDHRWRGRFSQVPDFDFVVDSPRDDLICRVVECDGRDLINVINAGGRGSFSLIPDFDGAVVRSGYDDGFASAGRMHTVDIGSVTSESLDSGSGVDVKDADSFICGGCV